MDDRQPVIVSCPNGGDIYSGRIIATRDSPSDTWVFIGELGRRVDGFDPATTRTSHPCIKDKCPNHTEATCLAGDFVNALPLPETPSPRDCPITTSCRWRLEHGSRICITCPGVNHPGYRIRTPPPFAQGAHYHDGP